MDLCFYLNFIIFFLDRNQSVSPSSGMTIIQLSVALFSDLLKRKTSKTFLNFIDLASSNPLSLKSLKLPRPKAEIL